MEEYPLQDHRFPHAAQYFLESGNRLDFPRNQPIMHTYLPLTRLALVARVGLSQQKSPVWHQSLTGLFVSGVCHAA